MNNALGVLIIVILALLLVIDFLVEKLQTVRHELKKASLFKEMFVSEKVIADVVTRRRVLSSHKPGPLVFLIRRKDGKYLAKDRLSFTSNSSEACVFEEASNAEFYILNILGFAGLRLTQE